MYPLRVIDTVISVPPGNKRSNFLKRRRCVLAARLRVVPFGQPLPLQVIFTVARAGVRTNSRLNLAPSLVRLPNSVILTPCRSFSGRAPTVMRRSAVATAPLESVTLRPTLYDPLGSFRVATAPEASSYWPSPSRSHCWEASGPSGSPEVEDSVTVSPSRRVPGATLKEAWGGALTTTVPDATAKPPPVSVTRIATVLGPGVAKDVVAVAPEASGVKSLVGS